MPQLRFIRNIIYRLKREYGVTIKVVRRTKTQPTDYSLGTGTYLNNSFTVRRAIVLPTRELREDEYKIFETKWSRGAYFDTNIRSFYIDKRDTEFDIKKDDYIIHNSKRYDVAEISEFEEARSYIVIAKEVIGGPLYDTFEMLIQTDLSFNSLSGGTL